MSFLKKKLKRDYNWNKCDICGRFISFRDFEFDDATRKLLTPDSDYSIEEFETICSKCNYARFNRFCTQNKS